MGIYLALDLPRGGGQFLIRSVGVFSIKIHAIKVRRFGGAGIRKLLERVAEVVARAS